MHIKPVQNVFEVRIEEIIEVVNEVRYLGIILVKHLEFDSQVKYICIKV